MTHPRQFGLWALLLVGATPLAGCPVLAGEVTASQGASGLGTALDGVVGGSCGAGLCQVSGGTAAGGNLFHRFSAFDTRGAITGVTVTTGGIPNVFMAVTSPIGSFIDKPVSFSGPTNLVWLSPGGISVGGAGGFANVQQLNLSTATGWKVGSGVFEAAGTTAGQAALLNGTPIQGLAGAVNDPAALTALGLQTNGDLSLAGGLLTVEKELLLDAQGGNVLLQAAGIEATGGALTIQGRSVLQAAPVAGTAVTIVAEGTVLNSAPVLASGSADAGGAIQLQAGEAVLQTRAAVLEAQAPAGATSGGTVSVAAGERLFSSATIRTSAAGTGGTIELTAASVTLADAQLDASGGGGGGAVRVGGGYQGSPLSQGGPKAGTVSVNPSTTLRADATASGNGGEVVVWAEGSASFRGRASARGGPAGGDGGRIEVSGREGLAYGGQADAGAAQGKAGSLLLDPKNIVIDATAQSTVSYDELFQKPVSGYAGIGSLERYVVTLANGNLAITNPAASDFGSNAGAVFVLDGATGALISSLVGTSPEDQVGSGGITPVNADSSSFVVSSPDWGEAGLTNLGAVTWMAGDATGSRSVSSSNSLVGSLAGDRVGGGGVTALTNGNYVVASPEWASGRGAVTWGSGSSGTRGPVGAENSLVGNTPRKDETTTGDLVGSGGVTALPNGNYVVASPFWSAEGGPVNLGAVTWRDGSQALGAVVGSGNSLIGTSALDRIGSGGITTLTNGNYVVNSPFAENYGGAVTWGSGMSGVSGEVSSANSLVGVGPDRVGSGGVTALPGGNYVVASPFWSSNTLNYEEDIHRGAVTWVDGSKALSAVVGPGNSLIGPSAFDQIGSGGITALTNGNYVVNSPDWGSGAGAVTWGSSNGGITGEVTPGNSLVGSFYNANVGSGGVTALPNGNYVVASPYWHTKDSPLNLGAVTWVDGSKAFSAVVGPDNSLVGTLQSDLIGSGGITALSNGNYVVNSPNWNRGAELPSAGAVTWASGDTGIKGTVDVSNSLVGSDVGGGYSEVGFGGVTALSNGNYVVRSDRWNVNRGAVTWGSGMSGVSGEVSSANSLVGASGDFVGIGGITELGSGDYLVSSPFFDLNRGAITWGSGTSGFSGEVSASNSLLGTAPNAYYGGSYLDTPGSQNIDQFRTLLQPHLGHSFVVVTQSGPTVPGLGQLISADPLGGGVSFSNAPAGELVLTPAQIAAVAASGTAVTLQANNDITLASGSPINFSGASVTPGTLTLQAGRAITLQSSISTFGGDLQLFANDPAAIAAYREPGDGGVLMQAGSGINAGGGKVTVQGGFRMEPDSSLTGSGVFTLQGANNSWGGGTITGPTVRVTDGSTLTLNGEDKFFGQGTLQIDSGGTLVWSAGNIITIGDEPISASRSISNWGLFDIQGDVGLISASDLNHLTAFYNYAGGELRRSSSLGIASLGSSNPDANSFLDFYNGGRVNVQTGTLQLLPTAGSVINYGTIRLADLATFSVPREVINLGTLTGSGTLDLAGNNLINKGSIFPGDALIPGTFRINGSVDLTGGSLNIDTLPDFTGQSDLLAVSGSATLGGTLNVTNVYGLSSGEWQPIVSGARVGSSTFTTTNLPNFDGLAVGYGLASGEAARLILAPVYPPSGDSWIFTNAAGGLEWTTAGNWSGGVLPGALDTAVLSSGYAVQHSTGDHVISGLQIFSANSLNLTGGSLTVTGPTDLSGVFTVAGGSANLSGSLNGNSGAVAVQSGSLSLDGFSSLGSFSQSGGILTGSGNLTLTGAAGAPNEWRGGAWEGGGITTVANGAVLAIGNPAPANDDDHPQLLGRTLQVASGGTVNLESTLDVKTGTSTLTIDNGGSFVFSSFGPAGFSTVFAKEAGILNINNSGTVSVNPGTTGTVYAYTDTTPPLPPSNADSRIVWTDTGSLDLGAGSTLSLYSNYGNPGTVVNLNGALSVPAGATLSSTSSNLTITPAGTGAFELGGSLLVNAGTTSLNLGATTANSSIGTVKLIDGTLALNGSTSPSASTSVGELQLLGGTLSGSGALAITQAFNRGTYSALAPNAFSALSITQVMGDLNPGTLSVAGPLGLQASSGALTFTAPVSASSIFGTGSNGLSIGSTASLTATGDSGQSITLSSGSGAFLNSAGSTALSVTPGAFWQIYADSPLTTPIANLGGLAYAFKQYGKTLDDTVPIAGSGNGLFFALSPSVSASLLGPISKQYDGTTTASLLPANVSLSGVQTGDSLLLNTPTTASYDNKNVGSAKLVSVSGLSLASASDSASGVPVYGYSLASSSASGTVGSITKAPLSITASSDTRTYDGTTASSLTPTIVSGTVFDGDSLSDLSQRFLSKNVLGDGSSTLSVNSDFLLNDGNGGFNYSVTLQNASGSITPKTLSITGTTAAGRTYDGTANASFNLDLGSLSGLIGGEQLNVSATGNFDSKNAGLRSATATYLLGDDSATGGLAANYSLAPSTGLAATITKAPLSITASSDTRTYDGTTSSSGAPTYSGLISGDALSGLSQSFNTKDVLTANSLSVNSGYVLDDGNGGANYAVSLASASGSISRRPQSTWSGLGSGLWSDPANWDALPSAANVATVLIPAGTVAVSYDASAGSTQLLGLINHQSLSVDGGSLAVSGDTTVGPGATLSLNHDGFSTTTLLNQGLVNGSGALLLDGSYSEGGAGRLGTGFSRVAISQEQGDLRLSGVGASGPISLASATGDLNLNGAVGSNGAPIELRAAGALSLASGSSLLSPGGTITLSSGAVLSVEGAAGAPVTIDAGGATAGGTVELNGDVISLTNARLNTSGSSDGGSIRIGGVSAGLGTSLPSSVTISRSSLVADPPDLGGAISVDGGDIVISDSRLDVFGLSGGSISLGSAATARLSLDALTSLVGGGQAAFTLVGNPVQNLALLTGGTLSLNGRVIDPAKTPAPDPTPALPALLAFQQVISPIPRAIQDSPTGITTPSAASLLFNQWIWVGETPLQIGLGSPTWLDGAPSRGTQQTPAVNPGDQGGFQTGSQPIIPEQVRVEFSKAEQEALEKAAAKLGLQTAAGQSALTTSDIQAILREVTEAVRRRLGGGRP